MWPLVMYSNCVEWNLSKEQMVINLYAMLLLEACVLLYHYTISNDYIVQGIIFAVPGLYSKLSTCLSSLCSK